MTAYSSNRNQHFLEGPKRVSSPRSSTYIRSLSTSFVTATWACLKLFTLQMEIIQMSEKPMSFSVKRGGWRLLVVITYQKGFGAVKEHD